MTAALLLIDLQQDFLATPGLTPGRDEVVRGAAHLLRGCRRLRMPVIHVWTTVSPDGEDRMPHWKEVDRRMCVSGTDGHLPPPPLLPDGEPVVDKQHFSAFSSPALDPLLRELRVDEVVLAGVHLHGCVRQTAIDAYARGLAVTIADDAVASAEPLHAAITREYLERRCASFIPGDGLLRRSGRRPGGGRDGRGEIEWRSPARREALLWRLPTSSSEEVHRTAARAAEAGREWRRMPQRERDECLRRLESLLAASSHELSGSIARETGKPITGARAEVSRAVALVGAASRAPGALSEATPEARVVRPPLGTVALVTPWNNPLAIPVGKLAPALHYGNAIVLKPAPAASAIAGQLLSLLSEAGCPEGLVGIVRGGGDTAVDLMSDRAIDGVALTGSIEAGYTAQAICAERRIPLQAELGGNNAAILWRDVDLAPAAEGIAEAAFGAAGQRCTANRRVIVDERVAREFLYELEAATAGLRVGDPLDESVSVGPLISDSARDRVAAVIERAQADGEVRRPDPPAVIASELARVGSYLPPTIIVCDDPGAEVVREETFGPVLVVQAATTFDAALELMNGVEHGLVAALYSNSRDLKARFRARAEAGVLKFNRPTADVGVETPFGGWKSSGVGPPEHGSANLDFYTRIQAQYG